MKYIATLLLSLSLCACDVHYTNKPQLRDSPGKGKPQVYVEFSTTPYMVYHKEQVDVGTYEYWMKLPGDVPGSSRTWILRTSHGDMNEGDQFIMSPYKPIVPQMFTIPGIPSPSMPGQDEGIPKNETGKKSIYRENLVFL